MLNAFSKHHREGLSDHSQGGMRIGLISPYTGSNLGDAAIIESVRAHLSRLFPGAEILLIVLNCERVSELHGLGTFPLTAIPRPFYFTPGHTSTAKPSSKQYTFPTMDATSLHLRMRSVLKRVAGHIPLVLPVARRLRGGLGAIVNETRHIFQTRHVVSALDGLIIAGGGQFDDEYGGPWGHPYALYKWIRMAHRAGVPVYFAGVGVCEINSSLTRSFLRGALSRADRVSLRDAGSLNILRRQGIQRDLVLCPDLAFGLPVKDDSEHSKQSAFNIHPTIGISPIVFGRPGNWPTTKTAIFNRYWSEFKALASSLLKEDFILRLFVTDSPDYYLAKMLHDQLVNEGADMERIQLLPMLSLMELIPLLKTCDAVIASRLHGVLLSHVCALPVLGISYHRKVRAHMEDIGQEGFCLDFETFTALEARNSLHRLLTVRDSVISEVKLACAERYRDVEREFVHISSTLA
jgi:polysaccharide pyruvyl transferase WcaK-like protein